MACRRYEMREEDRRTGDGFRWRLRRRRAAGHEPSCQNVLEFFVYAECILLVATVPCSKQTGSRPPPLIHFDQASLPLSKRTPCTHIILSLDSMSPASQAQTASHISRIECYDHHSACISTPTSPKNPCTTPTASYTAHNSRPQATPSDSTPRP
jgi:hypothetical protein